MESVVHTVPGIDGELIYVEESGEPGGRPVLVHPGSPGSRRLSRMDGALAREHALRLLSYDRPGYRGRVRREGRQIADAAADVECIARALGISRLGVWGASGGGCYALACAAMLPGLVTGAAVFATFAPYGSPGLDFCEGWPEEYRSEVGLYFTDRAAARDNWRRDSDGFLASLSTPQAWMARWGQAAGTDDAHNWDTASHLAAGIRDSLSGGDDGYWDDWAAVLTPWGCDLTATSVPVRLWHGVRDQAVPIAHGRWLAANVPGIQAYLTESEDHTNVEHNNKKTACTWLSGLT